MKFRVEVDGRDYQLELQPNGTHSAYTLHGGEQELAGNVSVSLVSPGVYSVLLGNCSYAIYLAKAGEKWEAWAEGRRRFVSIVDPRDDVARGGGASGAGRLELRTPMPGKIIKILVGSQDPVRAGQGLVVVEAMKMQNEIRSPKDGVVASIHAVEGVTVGAGALLVTVE